MKQEVGRPEVAVNIEPIFSRERSGGSRNFCSGLYGFFRRQDDDAALVGGGEQHSLAFKAPEFCGFEIGYNDDLFADKFFRRVVISNTGADLPLLLPELDLQDHQLVGIRMRFGGFYG